MKQNKDLDDVTIEWGKRLSTGHWVVKVFHNTKPLNFSLHDLAYKHIMGASYAGFTAEDSCLFVQQLFAEVSSLFGLGHGRFSELLHHLSYHVPMYRDIVEVHEKSVLEKRITRVHKFFVHF